MPETTREEVVEWVRVAREIHAPVTRLVRSAEDASYTVREGFMIRDLPPGEYLLFAVHPKDPAPPTVEPSDE